MMSLGFSPYNSFEAGNEFWCERRYDKINNLTSEFRKQISRQNESFLVLCEELPIRKWSETVINLFEEFPSITTAEQFCRWYNDTTALHFQFLDACDFRILSSAFWHWLTQAKPLFSKVIEQSVLPKCLAFEMIQESQGGTLVTVTDIVSSTPAECEKHYLDLVFLMDGSGSINPDEFRLLIDFIKGLTSKLNLTTDKVGVMQYSHWYRNRPTYQQRYMDVEISLGQFDNQRDFNRTIDCIEHHGYTTYTAHAMVYSVEYIFMRSERFNDSCTKKIMIVITDGRSTDSAYLSFASQYAKENNVSVIAIGVRGYKQEELQIIANGEIGESDRVYTVDTFNGLSGLIQWLAINYLMTSI